jgi:ATP-dependent DNA helicase RecG
VAIGNLPKDVVDLVDRVISGIPADTLEGQRLEFKSGQSLKGELSKIAEATVCLANAEGGLLIVGVTDRPGGRAALVGAHATEDQIVRHLVDAVNPPLTVGVDSGTVDGVAIVAVNVIRGVRVHALSDGQVKARFGKSCVPLEPSQVAALEADRLGYDPSGRPTDLTWRDADPSALAIARSQVSRLPDARSDLANFNDVKFLTKLGVADADGTLNVAGQLMFTNGTEDLATYQYRPTPGSAPTAVERLQRPAVLAFTRILELVAARRNLSQMSLPGGQQLDMADFPERAVREALANAFVHRLLGALSPVAIEHSAELLVIESPGPLVNGVSLANILTTQSRPRNPALAKAFRNLGLIEELGTGVPRMYREMVRSGKEPPAISAGPNAVRVALAGGFGNKSLARFIAGLPVDEANDTDTLLTILHLCDNATVNAADLAGVLQRPPSETARILKRLALPPADIVEPTRESVRYRDPNYRFRSEVLEQLGTVVRYKRRTSDEIDRKIVRHVSEYGRITNHTVRNLLEVGTPRASAILRRLVDSGVLSRTSEATRGPGVEYGPGPGFGSHDSADERLDEPGEEGQGSLF